MQSNPFRPQPRADPARVGAALGAEVALGGAVFELEARGVAEAARRIGMPHQRNVAAGAQRAPGLGLAGASAIRPGAEPKEDCKDGETDAAHQTSSYIRDQAIMSAVMPHAFETASIRAGFLSRLVAPFK